MNTTFSEIHSKCLSDLQILDNSEIYFAHKPPDHQKNKSNEPLSGHLKLVEKYLLHIINTHKLEFVIDNLINSLIQTFQTDNKLFSFFKTLFFNSIIYHDFGKINNKFQHVKMHNNNPKLKDIKHNQETKHSAISAYLFSMHHLKNSEYLNLTDAEQTITDFIITCFAYPILRHHSSIIVDVPKDNSLDIKVIESLKGFLHLFSINIGKDEINELHEIISDTESSFAQLKELKIKIDL